MRPRPGARFQAVTPQAVPDRPVLRMRTGSPCAAHVPSRIGHEPSSIVTPLRTICVALLRGVTSASSVCVPWPL